MMLLGLSDFSISDVLNDPINYVKGQAQVGAEAAIPQIQDQVKATVEPYIVLALLLGVGGLIFGAATYYRKPKPGLAGRHRR